MSEHGIRRTYWISTSLLALVMLYAGVLEVSHSPDLLEAMERLGFPAYLLTLLGTAKLIGAPLLLVQKFPRLKEWVYAGFSFDFGGAIICHTIVGDTLEVTLPSITCATLLVISYVSYRARGPLPLTRGDGS